jgi:hypothetical protein
VRDDGRVNFEPAPNAWAATLERLGRERISGLLGVAAFDRRKPDEAGWLTFPLYLKLDHGYLELQAVKSFGGLQVTHVDDIDLAEFREELGEDVYAMRLDPLFLGESREPVRCLAVNYLTNRESDLAEGIVRAAEFVLEHGHRLFFDPMWTRGVRVGNTDDWTRDLERHPLPLNRHTWTR